MPCMRREFLKEVSSSEKVRVLGIKTREKIWENFVTITGNSVNTIFFISSQYEELQYSRGGTKKFS